jgi:hypothetical protein
VAAVTHRSAGKRDRGRPPRRSMVAVRLTLRRRSRPCSAWHCGRLLLWPAEAPASAWSLPPRPPLPRRIARLFRVMASSSLSVPCDAATSLISGHFAHPCGLLRQPLRGCGPPVQTRAPETRPRCVPALAASAFSLHGSTVFAPSPSLAPCYCRGFRALIGLGHVPGNRPDGTTAFGSSSSPRHRDIGTVKRTKASRLTGSDSRFYNPQPKRREIKPVVKSR